MKEDTRTSNPRVIPKGITLPFILITTCFALWGFANDITNPNL
jgi:FHS family L-fucose permease-like MFS transporter